MGFGYRSAAPVTISILEGISFIQSYSIHVNIGILAHLENFPLVFSKVT